MSPRDLSFADMDFTVPSPNGISSRYVDPAVVMLDGSVRRLTPRLSKEGLRALLTIRGGEKFTFHEEEGIHFLQDGRDRESAEK